MKEEKESKNKSNNPKRKAKNNKTANKSAKFKMKKYETFVILGSFLLLLLLALKVTKNNNISHCKKAVCNEEKTICYNYKLDSEGNTVKTWQGSCKLNK